MKRILKSKWMLVLMIVSWLLFLWVQTFTELANGNSGNVLGVLVTSILAIGGTLVYGWIPY